MRESETVAKIERDSGGSRSSSMGAGLEGPLLICVLQRPHRPSVDGPRTSSSSVASIVVSFQVLCSCASIVGRKRQEALEARRTLQPLTFKLAIASAGE